MQNISRIRTNSNAPSLSRLILIVGIMLTIAIVGARIIIVHESRVYDRSIAELARTGSVIKNAVDDERDTLFYEPNLGAGNVISEHGIIAANYYLIGPLAAAPESIFDNGKSHGPSWDYLEQTPVNGKGNPFTFTTHEGGFTIDDPDAYHVGLLAGLTNERTARTCENTCTHLAFDSKLGIVGKP